MPITKSAKKALKRSRFLRARNLQFKIPMKKAIKAVRKSVAQGAKKEEVLSLLLTAYSRIDRAAKRNIVHHRAAARLKSRLVSLVKNKLGVDPFENEVSKKSTKANSQKTSESTTKKSSSTTSKRTAPRKSSDSKKAKRDEDN